MRQLYTFFRSSTSYRVRIALSLKGLDWEPRFVSLPLMEHKAPDYLATNPQGLVPALVEDGQVLTQSLAIIEYLDEVYPEPPLLPRAPLERAYVRALALIVSCDIHPLNNVRVIKALKSRWGLADAEIDDWYATWIAEGFQSFEAMLARAGRAASYCLGDRIGLADVCLVPQVANARRFNCDLAPYPKLVAIADRAAALPALARVAPQTQADAF